MLGVDADADAGAQVAVDFIDFHWRATLLEYFVGDLVDLLFGFQRDNKYMPLKIMQPR